MDVAISALGLLVALPIIIVCAALVFFGDRKDPIYRSRRIGRLGRQFDLYKIRTMVVGASGTGVDTTVANDPRLLPWARPIRALKLDELPQLYNVLKGDMSLVGPRPNVPREVARYTDVERDLLTVRPGITDFASIVFSDLASAFPAHLDPNLGYAQYVRPWKSRLGLHYVHHASAVGDLTLGIWTLLNTVARRAALRRVSRLLEAQGASGELVRVASRTDRLVPAPPPGSATIVTEENLRGFPPSGEA